MDDTNSIALIAAADFILDSFEQERRKLMNLARDALNCLGAFLLFGSRALGIALAIRFLKSSGLGRMMAVN